MIQPKMNESNMWQLYSWTLSWRFKFTWLEYEPLTISGSIPILSVIEGYQRTRWVPCNVVYPLLHFMILGSHPVLLVLGSDLVSRHSIHFGLLADFREFTSRLLTMVEVELFPPWYFTDTTSQGSTRPWIVRVKHITRTRMHVFPRSRCFPYICWLLCICSLASFASGGTDPGRASGGEISLAEFVNLIIQVLILHLQKYQEHQVQTLPTTTQCTPFKMRHHIQFAANKTMFASTHNKCMSPQQERSIPAETTAFWLDTCHAMRYTYNYSSGRHMVYVGNSLPPSSTNCLALSCSNFTISSERSANAQGTQHSCFMHSFMCRPVP